MQKSWKEVFRSKSKETIWCDYILCKNKLTKFIYTTNNTVITYVLSIRQVDFSKLHGYLHIYDKILKSFTADYLTLVFLTEKKRNNLKKVWKLVVLVFLHNARTMNIYVFNRLWKNLSTSTFAVVYIKKVL